MANLVQRPTVFLESLDLQEAIEVFGTVVIAAANAIRFRQELFLNVVPHRAARDASQFCQIADGVAWVIRHATSM